MPDFGDMTDLLTVERATTSRGAAGGVTKTWATHTTVWAKPMPQRGREFFAARHLLQEKNAVFRIRYPADITAADRIVWDGLRLNIIDIYREDGKRDFLLVYCSSGAAQGA